LRSIHEIVPGTGDFKRNRAAHVGRRREYPALKVLALALAGILSFGTAAVSSAASKITSNVVTVDLDHVISHERPTFAILPATSPDVLLVDDDDVEFVGTELTGALNILIMGTDDRSGENGDLADRESTGARSDSTMILHIAADRSWATVVSIPRDTIVRIPSCPTSAGKYTKAYAATRFNAAFAYGVMAGGDVASGALCTLTTVEKITNVRMDGFIVLDFAGFKNMVDALGGVELEVQRRIHSPLAGGLKLDAGLQTLDGWQALQYARARTGVGLASGSDLDRIKRQQQLVSSIASQVLTSNLLTSSPQLLRFIDATTSSMTTSSNYATATGLLTLAKALSAVDPAEIQFVTAPVASNPEDPNTVVLTSRAKLLWDNLRYDQRPS
jgi:LCP family protein required for cell wall assembly